MKQMCFSCADLQADLESAERRIGELSKQADMIIPLQRELSRAKREPQHSNDAEALRDLAEMVELRGERILELEAELKKMTREMRDMRKALATRDIPGYNPQYEERIRQLETMIEEKGKEAQHGEIE